ncbi:ATP-dependent helicase HrpB [Aliivibrio sifiae]|uniref:ATP-dependent helicase n=1 Tax=Aliivibrio sifiae TaxID=566293 RepID=A0A2S7XGF8_9GAMM|nr:ATP-dependent helicase HrpB [Aliivibrio sifiae]PQJ92578.1 ATP-dependent helicase HrpB [Aliivibrio sifiae]GLR76848.1 ATP-dependent helicase [Aliivibrio sifiae]
MSQLPIERVIPSLIEGLRHHSQIILKASTGAGKSTHLPLMLLKENVIEGKIIMLEPRRLAARNIANYLASQLGESVGEQVGFRVRGETKVSSKTRLEIVTEGVMTRMLQADPELSGVGLLIFDEYHERSLHADTSLAFSLEVQEALRDDLKILVMSATLDQESLKSLLPMALYLESDGRLFPVDTSYVPLKANQRIVEATELAIRRTLTNELGSILVFLSGVGEIKQLEEQLKDLPSDIVIASLYGQLDPRKQQQALKPAAKGQRKVVLATNIAETSLTIEGIRIVIDSGYERKATFDVKTGITKLEQRRIAQSSAEQRKGRAGRLEPGLCIRLYSESQFLQQALLQSPEIESSDLSSLVLELSKWGVTNPLDLQWLTPPPNANTEQARSLLCQLGFIDLQGQLTALGEQSQRLGLEPRLAAIILQAQQHSIEHLHTALYLLPIIEEPAKSISSKDLSFHLSLLVDGKYPKQAYYQQRIQRLAKLLSVKEEAKLASIDIIGEVLAVGFPERLAMAKGSIGQFQLANGHGVQMDEIESIAQSDYLVVVDLLKGNQNRSYVFLAASLSKSSLMDVASHLITESEYVDWDEKSSRMVAENRRYLGKLILERKSISSPDPDKISFALLSMLKRKGLMCLDWNKGVQALHSRLQCCREWLPEISLPAMRESELLESADEWLLPFMNGIKSDKQLKTINLIDALEAYVGWDKIKQINEYFPTHYLLPTGTKAKICYELQSDPKISVRMQEVYGEAQTPLLAKGTKKLVMELLSPAQRPLQTTSDLAGFWNGSYKEVQKEMKGRYPKHIWPDDPATHQATKKTKRHFN